MCTVKAAPADEVRAVRHARRREALTLEELRRGFRKWTRKRHGRFGWAVSGSIEAGRCEQLGHPARQPEPREWSRAGKWDTHAVTNDARIMSCAHTTT
jgi:hypothetical protein